MLQDPKLMAAVSKIVQRSERQDDPEKLLGTYVDIGLLSQLDNRNHQIFYGRRGTGKTHVMKVLDTVLRKESKNTVVYIDCRTLGSTSQFSDRDAPIPKRCLALFRDFLLTIYHGLLEHIVNEPSKTANEALTEADTLVSLITEPLKYYQQEKVVSEEKATQGTEASMTSGLGVSLTNVNAKIGGSRSLSASISEGQSTEYSVRTEDKVVFPELQRSIKKVLELADSSLYILVDEWSSLPIDIQPFLAEFLKRGISPLSTATLKISALEYRCRFREDIGGITYGFELGADIATAPDLDDYFVYDRNPDQVTDVCADVLLKHISSELPENYLKKEFTITNPRQFASRMFTERNTFSEMVRASEGVLRDLINIFTQAYFHSQRRGRDSIDKKAVLDSARQWFEQDKAQYLDDSLQEVMRKLVEEVIGKKKARSFLLPRHLERHPVVQKLFDARVLHHMQRGYADKDNPGIRYNIYTIDYGAYVDLIGTSKEPELELKADRMGADLVVPFDDKRSIRRIILEESILS